MSDCALATLLAFATILPMAAAETPPVSDDPWLWLEDVAGDKALDWVRARNAETLGTLGATPAFTRLQADIRRILDARDRIPDIVKEGDRLYNFWKDEAHPRGLWRRTTLAEYRKAEPAWEVLLDLDAMAAAEGENWVWHGAGILRPDCRRALLRLSRGGADAVVVREFDLVSRSFVVDGFALPEAKGGVDWISRDEIHVSTDFGLGSQTTSGYPRIAKRWRRGTPLAQAVTVFEGRDTDMSVSAGFDDTPGFERHLVHRRTAFYAGETHVLGADGVLRRIPVPDDAMVDVHREWIFTTLRTPWSVGGATHPSGALLAGRFDAVMAGRPDWTAVFTPTATCTLASFRPTLRHVILNLLDDVSSRIVVATPGAAGWTTAPLPGAQPLMMATAWALDARESDDYLMQASGFLTPPTLSLGSIGGGAPERLKAMPDHFPTTGLAVSQHFVVSQDGTRVPYFLIARKDLPLDGSTPTLLYGYGGFEIAVTPGYNGVTGHAWLAKGGAYAVANIRGGGEYGPAWHQAALKEKRLRAYEDFAAVAQDLVARKVTSVPHLGARGGSNGGLLMGNMITRYPQRFGAIVCQVPLLDMKRYNHLLAGASWMAEYGDPDQPDQWAWIRTFSPYHNLTAGTAYPPVLFMTSTRDDRVHPGHARKMMARMQELGADVRYYENIEGGHGGAANNEQAATMTALYMTFLWERLR